MGEDFVATLDMVEHLNGQDFADEIVKIDMNNHAGRVDPREAQIVLVTKHNTEVRWGRG